MSTGEANATTCQAVEIGGLTIVLRPHNTGLHTDFGQGTNGIPYIVVKDSEPKIDINFIDGGDEESDPGPYPMPLDAPVTTANEGREPRLLISFSRSSN